MKEAVLVSVIVITYNSELFILEALESIKNQTYEFIELIISDDGSTDDTVKIVEKWLLQNNGRFKNHKLVKSDVNTGITANLNRGVLASGGKYIKLIAADDLLLENSIADLLKFCLEKKLLFCFSRAMPFSNTADSKFITDKIKDNEINLNYFFDKSQLEQYKALLRATTPFTIVIGGFYSRELIEKIGYFDEKYEMMEDYPFLIKISALGFRFELLDKYTTKYRMRPVEDIKSFKMSKRYNVHYKNLRDFRKNEIVPRMIRKKMYFSTIYMKITMWLLELEYEEKNKAVLSIVKCFRKLKQSLITSSQRVKSKKKIDSDYCIT